MLLSAFSPLVGDHIFSSPASEMGGLVSSIAGEAVLSSFGDLQDVVPVTSHSGEVRGALGLCRVWFAGWQRTALTCARVPAWLGLHVLLD